MAKGKITITTSSTKIVGINNRRSGIIIENRGFAQVHIDAGADATLNDITIQPFEKFMLLIGDLTKQETIQQQWNGIVLADSHDVSFKELF